MLYCFHLPEGRVRGLITLVSDYFKQRTEDNLRNDLLFVPNDTYTE